MAVSQGLSGRRRLSLGCIVIPLEPGAPAVGELVNAVPDVERHAVLGERLAPRVEIPPRKWELISQLSRCCWTHLIEVFEDIRVRGFHPSSGLSHTALFDTLGHIRYLKYVYQRGVDISTPNGKVSITTTGMYNYSEFTERHKKLSRVNRLQQKPGRSTTSDPRRLRAPKCTKPINESGRGHQKPSHPSLSGRTAVSLPPIGPLSPWGYGAASRHQVDKHRWSP